MFNKTECLIKLAGNRWLVEIFIQNKGMKEKAFAILTRD